MRRYFLFAIVLLLVLACATDNTPNTIFKRSFKANTTAKLALNKTIQYQQITFNYFKNDVTNLSVNFLKSKNKLVINTDTFFVTNKRYTYNNLEFNMYKHKTDSTNLKTVVFNKNYGLLAVIGLANDAVFLKDSLSVFKNEAVFKDILLAFNKLD